MYFFIIYPVTSSGINGLNSFDLDMYAFKNYSLNIPFTGTFLRWCTFPMWIPSSKSFFFSAVSSIIKIKSNLDNKAAGRFRFFCVVYCLLYLPYIGFAAANTAVLAFSVVMIPAFVIETVCCSMTSWIAVLSYSSILSNSSIQHTPMSASTKAPASSESYLVLGSVTIAAVRPTPELPLPVVYTARGEM